MQMSIEELENENNTSRSREKNLNSNENEEIQEKSKRNCHKKRDTILNDKQKQFRSQSLNNSINNASHQFPLNLQKLSRFNQAQTQNNTIEDQDFDQQQIPQYSIGNQDQKLQQSYNQNNNKNNKTCATDLSIDLSPQMQLQQSKSQEHLNKGYLQDIQIPSQNQLNNNRSQLTDEQLLNIQQFCDQSSINPMNSNREFSSRLSIINNEIDPELIRIQQKKESLKRNKLRKKQLNSSKIISSQNNLEQNISQTDWSQIYKNNRNLSNTIASTFSAAKFLQKKSGQKFSEFEDSQRNKNQQSQNQSTRSSIIHKNPQIFLRHLKSDITFQTSNFQQNLIPQKDESNSQQDLNQNQFSSQSFSSQQQNSQNNSSQKDN